jgi:GNAT superfamily N-acetyltransferase
MRPPVIIRPMETPEQDAVARLFHDVWHETQSHLQDPRRGRFRDIGFFRKRLVDHAGRTLLACAEDEILGFGCWTGGHFDSLFVRTAARGGGVGQELLEAIEVQMAAGGTDHFVLDCLIGNTAGRRFYERHGWHVSHERYWEDETPEGPAWARSWVMVKQKPKHP